MSDAARPVLRWLDEIGEDDLADVGGKALNLARLRRAGFCVPNGFAIDAALLRQTASRHKVGVLPRRVTDEILAAYHQLGVASVAVRSSATVEDSAESSFAGQARSVLGIRTAAALLEAVRAVAASADDPAFRSYAQQRGVPSESIAVHVVIQELIDADVAGVLFTVDPVSGSQDEMVINAAWGLGEPVVSGAVTPDHVVVSKSTGRSTSYQVGGKTEGCLDEGQIRCLAETGRRIEEHFGAPQDVEWAWRDRLYVLQARPLTAAPLEDGPESLWQQELVRLSSVRGAKDKVWVAKGIAEHLRCPTPLSWDVASRLMCGHEGYGLAHRRLGYDPAPGPILERLAGHVYVDLDREVELFFRHAPLAYALDEIRENPLRAAMPRQVLDWRRLRPVILLRLPGLALQLARVVSRTRGLRRDFPCFLHDSFLPEFERYVRAERETHYGELTGGALVDLFERRLDHLLRESSPVLMVGSILGAMAYRDLEDLLIDRMGSDGIGLTQQLLVGLTPNATVEMHEAMSRLARGEETEGSFLDRFGHRCGNEFELAEPRWREDRGRLREQLAQADVAARLGGGAAAREAGEARLDDAAHSWGPVARDFVRSRSRTARDLVPLRELARDNLMKEYELLRAPLAELGRRLGLDDGVFYLHHREIRSAVDGKPVQDLVATRREEHRRQQRLRPPHVISGRQLLAMQGGMHPTDGRGDGLGHTTLRGVGVSPGVITGRVRVIRSPDELAAIQQGEIVVLPSLDPTWTAAYTRAGGLVAERGAVLSHGAIVAREFRIPAVANVPGVTDHIQGGQQVEVDGTAGRVQVLRT